ncbi:MAG: hypothetical protein AB7I30_09895 [Isosphaeraceae bacterium]
MNRLSRPGLWVFVVLLGSYAFFWQSRDWNSASRLMLTYAIVDRGTIVIDGLEDQTHDRASFDGHYYSDKLPGFSILAVPVHALAKWGLGLPDHPLDARGFAFWPADYWVTLGTSALLTAMTGVVLCGLARDLGCGPRRSALVGLAYGLATPAYVYATMSYGHQASAFALISAFALLWRTDAPGTGFRAALAGFLAAYASVIELQVGPVSAILGLHLIAQVVTKARKRLDLGLFALGAAIPTLLLLSYHQMAFGSPFDMGYFHHDTKIFADVHSRENPLGLSTPGLATALALIWGRHRGLLFYAPIVGTLPFGIWALIARRAWGALTVSLAAMAAVFLVNVSYPEWTGGWSTGPRLLLPLLPFAMVPVAAWLGRGGRVALAIVVSLAMAGGVLMTLFIGVGGRVPQFFDDPLTQVVWPLWRGDRLLGWSGERFARTPVDWAPVDSRTLGTWADAAWKFAPLWIVQAIGIGLIATLSRGRRPRS